MIMIDAAVITLTASRLRLNRPDKITGQVNSR